MVVGNDFLVLFDFVFAHLEQLQVYEGLAKETETKETERAFLKHALALGGHNRDRQERLKVRTHLRMASLLCILLSGELFCWLLNFEEMYLSRGKGKSEIALIRKYSSSWFALN